MWCFAPLFKSAMNKISCHCSVISVTLCLIKLIYVSVTFAVLFFTADCREAERSKVKPPCGPSLLLADWKCPWLDSLVMNSRDAIWHLVLFENPARLLPIIITAAHRACSTEKILSATVVPLRQHGAIRDKRSKIIIKYNSSGKNGVCYF